MALHLKTRLIFLSHQLINIHNSNWLSSLRLKKEDCVVFPVYLPGVHLNWPLLSLQPGGCCWLSASFSLCPLSPSWPPLLPHSPVPLSPPPSLFLCLSSQVARANCYIVLALKSPCVGSVAERRWVQPSMGDGELNKHWPSELVSFTKPLSQLHSRNNLFTTQDPPAITSSSAGVGLAPGEN